MLAACGGNNTNPASGENETTNTGIASDGNLQLDPANVNQDVYPVVESLYEGLVKEVNGEIKGILAESYSVSDDRLDYIFDLRPGVGFHNGEPLNADAVVANFNRWFDPADPLRGSGTYQAWIETFSGFKGEVTETNLPKSMYDGIEKVNDLTVLIHLNTADPEFLKKISSPAFSIVAPAVLKDNQGDGGTGPYKFNSFNDDTYKLDPFENYWDTANIPVQPIEIAVK
jgi:peptide/nickel transport system substrate-binding protein